VTGVRLTLGWVAETTGGRVAAGAPDREVGPVVTDSRTLARGDFFIALRGPRFDAHRFVGEAAARGACGALVEAGEDAGTGLPEGFGLVRVQETTVALQAMARAVRAAVETRVVAITGSAGKTTTKEAIAAFLAPRFRAVKNKGTLNNHIGLPLSLLQLRDGPDAAVMELGMNHAGEIRALVGIAAPDVRVWTNVGDAHLGFFASPDAIADAKAEILEGAGADDVLVCNADDPRVAARARRFAGRTVTFGIAPPGAGPSAPVSAAAVEDLGIDGTRARVATPVGTREIETRLIGRGNLANVLAATAVALDFGVPLDEIAGAARVLAPAERRGVVHRLGGGVTLIDDSYNSSPAALRAALAVLASETRAARRVAVLGEMLELGRAADALHEACGRAVREAGADVLISVGGSPARALAAAAVAAGMPAAAVEWIPDSGQAAERAAALVRAGDLVLVKGSRGTRVDVVADHLVAEFA
jgi:UDP-N-acetylmuramoyl-tripeptide--D-alanyl-D-alanine ligase